MVYLATLALAGALVASSAIERWSQGLTGSLTVQIMPASDGETGERVAAALALLRGTPGVAEAEALSDERIAKLLSPWLGPDGARDLPLPALIDIRLAPDTHLDLAALAARLRDAVPNATLDDHQRWLHKLVMLGRMVELVALVVLLLIAAAAAAVTVFGTRTALAIHRHVIEVMHLIGAQDSYVARQFQSHALAIGLRGGLAGLVGAAGTLLAVARIVRPGSLGILPDLSLQPWQWGALALLPAATALIAMLTARLTVLRTLARMV